MVGGQDKQLLKTGEKNQTNIQQLMHNNTTEVGQDIHEIFYISTPVIIPQKEDIGRCYWKDFTFKSPKEAAQLIKDKKAIACNKNKTTDFFVYNERTGELVPFKKGDYFMDDHGYITFDGVSYTHIDNNGNEVRKSTYYTGKEEPDAALVLKRERKNAEKKKKKKIK